jgi:hypothetical protein
VWTPNRWIKVAATIVAVAIGSAVMLEWVAISDVAARFGDYSLAKQLFFSALALATSVIYLSLLAVIAGQRRLIIDRAGEKLSFSYGSLFRRTYSLPFCEIRALKNRMIEAPPNVSDDGPTPPSRVVFAELHDGTLVSLAINADWRNCSLHHEIEEAILTSGPASPEPADESESAEPLLLM